MALVLGLAVLATPRETHAQVSTNYWKLLANVLQPNIASWTFELPYLGGGGTRCVAVDNNGLFSATACGGGGGGGGSFNWNTATNYGQLVYATTTPTLWFQSGVFASSTSYLSNLVSTNATATNATTTNLAITGLSGNAGQCLTINASGAVVTITCGTSATFPFTLGLYNGQNVNSTSTGIRITNGASPLGLIASSTFVTFASSSQLSNAGPTWLTALANGTVNVDSSGLLYRTATSTATLSSTFSYTGVLGSFLGGTSGTLSIANNGLTLAMFPTIAANTVLGNNTSAVATPVAISTSTLYGICTGGQVVGWSNITNGLGCIATSTTAGSGITSITGPTGITWTGTPAVTGTLNSGFSIREIPSWTVGASGADFTTIQSALDRCGVVGGGEIKLTDTTYAIGGTGLLWKGSNCAIWGRGPGTTTISFTGATTAIAPNTTGFTHNEIHNVFFSGPGNTTSIAINWSNMTHGIVDNVQTSAVGTSLRLNDTTDTTFYNSFTNLDFNDNHAFCIDASSTNPVNDNYFSNIFCGDAATSNVISVQLNNGNGNVFNQINPEPATLTGTVGLKIFDNKLATNNGVFNNQFTNWYIEANGVGVSIADTVNPTAGGIQRNTFTNITSEANTVDWSVTKGAIALNSINGYDSNFGVAINNIGGPLTIGTSSQLQVNGTALQNAQFSVNASSTQSLNALLVGLNQTTYFRIDNSGNAYLPLITGTQCLHVTTGGVISGTGSDCGSGGGSSFPFTPTTNFAVNTSATSTPIWARAGIFASTTSFFDAGIFTSLVGIGTTSPYGMLSIGAPATTSPYFVIGSSTSEVFKITPSPDAFPHVGIGTTTPWGAFAIASAAYNYLAPLMTVSTSSGQFGNILTAFATTTTLSALAVSSLGDGFLGDSGARVGIGTVNSSGYPGLLDQLVVNGRIETQDWKHFECSPNPANLSIINDTAVGCGAFAFADGSDATWAARSGVLDAGMLTMTNINGNGGGFFVGDAVGTTNTGFRFSTTTVVMQAEVAAASIFTVAETGAIGTSSRYVGFTNTDSSGTGMSVEPTAGCYFVASSTQANWQALCRTSATAVTQVNTVFSSTTSAVNTLTTEGFMYRFRIEADNNSAKFYVSSPLQAMTLVANIATNYPNTTALNAGVYVAQVTGTAGGFIPGIIIGKIDVWAKKTLWLK